MPRGQCRYGRPKFFFNSTSAECEPTMNTRCRQGRLMFTTPWGCMRQCACKVPSDPGHCRQNIPRYYYNAMFKMCLPFQYSGCGGNQNNFGSFFECQFMCGNTESGFGAMFDA